MPAQSSKIIQQARSWPRRVVITVVVLAALLLAARIALPLVVQRMMNDRLQRIPGYTGHVNDLDIHLWRGAYSLNGVGIQRVNERVREPFFQAKCIDLSLAWRELWHGKFVSDIAIDHGQLNFV